MAYFRCGSVNKKVKLPKVSINGNASSGVNASSGAVTGGGASMTISTLGYRYADIVASSSSVGTGNNIDISEVSSITVSTSYTINIYHHQNPDGSWGGYYGGGNGTYSVVLHD